MRNYQSTLISIYTLIFCTGNNITDARDDNCFNDFFNLQTDSVLDNEDDVMSWQADDTDEHEKYTSTEKSLSITNDNTILQKENTSNTSIKESLLNTQKEKEDNQNTVKEKPTIIGENSLKTITNKDEYKDKSEEITINYEVQIPSMLKTQIMLDKKYIGESISSTNMTLKITKKN